MMMFLVILMLAIGFQRTDNTGSKGSCTAFEDSTAYTTMSTTRADKGGCFNGHDSPVNFREWLQFLGPCFEEKVLNGTYDPSTCPPTISRDMQKNLTRILDGLRTAVEKSSRLSTLASAMWRNLPSYMHNFCPGSFSDWLWYMKVAGTSAPPYTTRPEDGGSDAPGSYTILLSSLTLLCYLHDKAGREFFADPMVNGFLREYANFYHQYTTTPDSAWILSNHPQYGWFNECGRQELQIELYNNFNASHPHLGFHSFNEFFTRTFRDLNASRPLSIQNQDNPFILTSIGEQTIYNLASNLTLSSTLYIKNEGYSLINIFRDEEVANIFVGGYAIQGYFSLKNYHHYHSPVSGRILEAKRVPGLIWSVADISGEDAGDYYLNSWILNQEIYLAHVATRCIFTIQTEQVGIVGIVLVGMQEVSSCVNSKVKGDQVLKGEELGTFQFGGSNGLTVLQKSAVENSGMFYRSGGNTGEFWRLEELVNGKPFQVRTKIIDLSPQDTITV